MKQLPDFVKRAPGLFYFLGLVVFLGYVGVGTYEMSVYNSDPYTGTNSPVTFAARVRLILDALQYGGFFAANGVFLQINLAIWRLIYDRFEGREAAK